MDRLARLLVIVVFAAFAAATVAHAAGSTSMSLAMSAAAMVHGHMGDCDGCPPADEGMDQACGQICLAPFAAIAAIAGFELPLGTGGSATSRTEEIVGRTGLPEPYPPRTSHLG